MQAYNHPNTDTILARPSSMTDEECESLPVHRVTVGNRTAITSYWEPSQEEIHRITSGHKVVLEILGERMPPVRLSVEASAVHTAEPTGEPKPTPRLCANCIRFETTPERSWIGSCNLVLPKFVKTTGNTTVRADDACDSWIDNITVVKGT